MTKRRDLLKIIRICFLSIIGILFFANIYLFSFNSYINSDAYLSTHSVSLPPDEVPPIIELNGGKDVTVALGTTFYDDGITAFDARTGTSVDVSGEVDTKTVGDYLVEYIATDENGNSASVTRIVHVIEPTGIIYLTFDDGPGAYTAALLDVLAKHNVKATFFVTCAGPDDMIVREYNEGHAVALHTCSHNYSQIYSSPDAYFNDLTAVQNRVKNLTGFTPTLMRFPGGSSNLVSRRYDGHSHIMSYLTREVENRGFTYFDWNVNSGDAEGVNTPDGIFDEVINGLKRGGSSVVLQHDIKGYSVDAVDRIITYGLENGFVFAKLDASSFNAHHPVNN